MTLLHHPAGLANFTLSALQCVGKLGGGKVSLADAFDEGRVLSQLPAMELLKAVEEAFGGDADYAMLHKIYGASGEPETRHSPATCIACDMKTISGDPDPRHVSTSFVERQNLTMRSPCDGSPG
jgi:hypothetical protein